MSDKALLLLVRVGYLRESALRTWLGREDIDLAVADTATASYLRLADYQLPLSPGRQPEEIYRACRRMLADWSGEKGVVGLLDSALPVVARLTEEFGLAGCGQETLASLTDKNSARAKLAAAGVPGPGFRDLGRAGSIRSPERRREAVDGLAYPLILKPADSSAGRGVIRVEGPQQLSVAWDEALTASRKGSLVVEEELIGDEISVETVSTGGRTAVLACTEKLATRGDAFVELGQALPARLESSLAEEVRAVVVAALRALDFDEGIAHTEVMLTEQGPRVIEVNPRPAGGCILDLLEAVSGVKPYDLLADLALGRPVDLEALDRLPLRGGAAIRFLVARPGIVRQVTGVAEVSALLDPLRERLVLLTRPGDVVEPVTTNLHRLGYVLTVGDSTEAAVERADRFQRMIDILTEHPTGQQLIPYRMPSAESWT